LIRRVNAKSGLYYHCIVQATTLTSLALSNLEQLNVHGRQIAIPRTPDKVALHIIAPAGS
jgi:hypothetical protein